MLSLKIFKRDKYIKLRIYRFLISLRCCQKDGVERGMVGWLDWKLRG